MAAATKLIKGSDKVIILGFAPDSRDLAPIDDLSFDVWALNELYMEMPRLEGLATAWFQLHGTEPPTVRDPNQTKHLGQLKCPVYMWQEHKDIPNSVAYPKEEVLRHFDTYGEGMAPDIPHERDRAYFTNSISWMIALAIYYGYKEIHMYGVNMAQDQEFEHQRPSCEFFCGWARGAGIKVYLPIQSDLLRSWVLYGYDDSSAYTQKLDARITELNGRIEGVRRDRMAMQEQAQMALNAELQLQGALEDAKYMINLGPRGGGVSDVRGNSQEPEVGEGPPVAG